MFQNRGQTEGWDIQTGADPERGAPAWGGWGYLNWRYQDQECPEQVYPDWGNQSLEAKA